MNTRIEHCLYQAGLTAQGCWEDLDTYTQEGIEKFAELIVRECCRVMESLPPSTYHVGRTRMSEEIKQHFGVEE